MRRTGQKRNSILSIFAIALSTLTFLVGNVPMANAQLKGVTLDFAAAEPTSYNHLVGGGRWNSGILNTDIARSLAGSQFKCGDIVSYLSKFEMDASNSITSIEPFTISSEFNFDLDTTGQSGAILGDVLAVSIDPSDSAQRGNGNSVATLVSETASGPIFTKGSVLSAVVEVSNLEQNEVVVVRMDVKIFCDPKLNPTGNLQALFKDAKLTFKNGSTPVSPAEPLNQGAKTVPMKELGALAIPQLSLVKTVTTGSCPGVKSLTVLQNTEVRYCYSVLNTTNGGGNPAAPIYNVSDISDDGGIFAEFSVALTGLSDQDGDGQLDDLAAGATATGEAVKTYNPTIDTTLLNTATVRGFDSIINPLELNATDSATLIIEVPDAAPSISINKLTNGSDGPFILVGEPVVWSYQLTNTGNRTLSNISVIDNQGVTVVCPETTLAVGQSITCDANGLAITGPYSNTATVSAVSEATIVTASDSSSYFGAAPSITLLKKTNGVDSAEVPVGDSVTWTYLVTNTGNVAIDSVVVTDNLVSEITCPKNTLAIAETMTCSATGVADKGYYENIGTARANFQGTVVSAEDASEYYGIEAKISIQKTTNGQDGGTIIYLTPIEWQYLVTNTGNVTLSNIVVVDDKGLTVVCPFTSLAQGEAMTCTASGLAGIGNYSNIGSVTASYGSLLASANDTSSYFGANPVLTLKKFTNGEEAPYIRVGDPVNWTYLVTNTGNVTVSGISVVDDQGVTVTCPKSVLEISEAMTCTGSGTATLGWYRNLGTVNGTFEQTNVSAQDSSTYFGYSVSITVDKRTNGSDNPTITAGSPVVWTYQVKNNSNVAVDTLTVVDDQGVSVTCPKTSLEPTEEIQCTASGTAIAGPYTNIATATAFYGTMMVQATDASSYFGAAGSIDVLKTPDTQTVTAGGSVTFTITISNTGNIPLSNIVVTDPLSPDCDRIFATLQVAEVVSFTCTKTLVQTSFTNVVTVSASTGTSTISDSDSAEINVDILPDISLTKTANPKTVPATGGLVDYTLRISNIGLEAVVVTALSDSKFPLSSACSALIGQPIAAGSFLECVIQGLVPASTGETSFINTATATAQDPEQNADTATATATITYGWYGRTPGFWKNNQQAWVSGYTPNQFIQDVFTIPGTLLQSGVLDLVKPSGKDRLIDGLNYQGGSNLSGGFQILMRAAIAALLNEAYYGIYYPGATSPAGLIAQVNSTLATQNRASYITLASLLDYWNNAIHSTLP
ncbi:MAG: DUF11 domain-containing protein [Actinobacteria bacterium]|nr:DUF11 domain-containing protein [Actinomycetota bacterium]